MAIGDKMINSLTGSNIKTIRVSAPQLAEIIYVCFVSDPGGNPDSIANLLKGKFFTYTDVDSPDNKFHLHISYFHRGLTVHRSAWVKNYETQEIFEWKGYTLGPLKAAFRKRADAERIASAAGTAENTNTNLYSQSRTEQSASLGNRRMKKVGVLLLVVFAVGIVAVVIRIASNQSGGKIVQEEAAPLTSASTPTPSPEEEKYAEAERYREQGEFEMAARLYESIPNYSDAEAKREDCVYQMAEALYKEGEYQEAKTILKKLSDYEPAVTLLKKVNKIIKNMPPDPPDIFEFYDTTEGISGMGRRASQTVEWDPVKGADGYEYETIETNLELSEEAAPYYEKEETTECYYRTSSANSTEVEFKVRAYKYVNGKKRYGGWSRTVYCRMN